MFDWSSVILALVVLVPLMAASIAIIAFWNYLRVRSWKLLVLSIAYALLAAHDSIPLINGNLLNYAILSFFSFLAFLLLAYVYYIERKARGIKITKLHWIIGGLVAFCSIAALLYFAFIKYQYELISQQFLKDFTYVVMISATILLAIYSIISLYSYYHIVKNKNTLAVMVGFVCLLLTYLLPLLFLTPPLVRFLVSNFDYIGLYHLSLTLLTFAGYGLFLIALLRPREAR